MTFKVCGLAQACSCTCRLLTKSWRTPRSTMAATVTSKRWARRFPLLGYSLLSNLSYLAPCDQSFVGLLGGNLQGWRRRHHWHFLQGTMCSGSLRKTILSQMRPSLYSTSHRRSRRKSARPTAVRLRPSSRVVQRGLSVNASLPVFSIFLLSPFLTYSLSASFCLCSVAPALQPGNVIKAINGISVMTNSQVRSCPSLLHHLRLL